MALHPKGLDGVCLVVVSIEFLEARSTWILPASPVGDPGRAVVVQNAYDWALWIIPEVMQFPKLCRVSSWRNLVTRIRRTAKDPHCGRLLCKAAPPGR